ncbi:hypothetical protein HK100_001245 [Physocladia obscura]|uniref:Uncharacterized protein n=1 Tax=Physocladia obscura TaxID=109957 RepID=A0AAD5T7N8_9FUNG|nr:hypothetical protein HK100_001245 [Physocladia obscura]
MEPQTITRPATSASTTSTATIISSENQQNKPQKLLSRLFRGFYGYSTAQQQIHPEREETAPPSNEASNSREHPSRPLSSLSLSSASITSNRGPVAEASAARRDRSNLFGLLKSVVSVEGAVFSMLMSLTQQRKIPVRMLTDSSTQAQAIVPLDPDTPMPTIGQVKKDFDTMFEKVDYEISL